MEGNNKNRSILIVLAIIAVLGLVWFLVSKKSFNDYGEDIVGEDETYEATPANGYGVTVRTDSELGEHLAGPTGRTLYTTTLSSCTGDCLEAWLPYIVSAPEEVESGGNVGTIKRGNAYQQTYNKIPLYYYRLDEEAGDTKGHTEGGVWFVARP